MTNTLELLAMEYTLFHWQSKTDHSKNLRNYIGAHPK
jgi:hypothetical protein